MTTRQQQIVDRLISINSTIQKLNETNELLSQLQNDHNIIVDVPSIQEAREAIAASLVACINHEPS